MPAKQPTNSDLLTEIRTMNTRLTALESWRIAEDAAKKAIADYQRGERTTVKDAETSEWLKVAKQVGIVLGIVIAILYAYAATKGLHP